MNKFLILGVCVLSSLSAWEDHPDRDEDRRNELNDSQSYVGSGYDWTARDRESKDDDHPSSGNVSEGTVLSGPDRDK